MAKKKKSKVLLHKLAVKETVEINLLGFLSSALYEHNAKDIIAALSFHCAFEGAPKAYSMAKFLMVEKDLDTIKAMWLLRYILDKWDDDKFVKKASAHFSKIMDKKELKGNKK